MARDPQDIRYTAVIGKKSKTTRAQEYALPNKATADALIAEGVLLDFEVTDKIGATRYLGVNRAFTMDEVQVMAEQIAEQAEHGAAALVGT